MVRQWCSAAQGLVARFCSAREGNVAMMFAIALVPLLVATGGLIDYTRMWTVETKMQDAADATATMLSKDAATMTQAQMQAKADAFFAVNFTSPFTNSLVVTPTYSVAGPSVTVKATAALPTYFLPLIGKTTLPVATSSTVVWGESRLRVALVLDTTGSMNDDGKIAALKTATHNLLKQLKDASHTDGDVYVSIIPFSKDVNAGKANFAASWLRWDLWDDVNGSCSKNQYTTKTTCQNAGKTWTAKNHNTWNGCVTDRDQSYDTLNTAPGVAATLFPTEQYASCATQLTDLSYDWTALNSAVDALTPNGNTNQAIGLQWGWQSLTAAPFTIPAYDPQYKYRKVIILLTDGMNTEDRWYGNSNQIDAREKVLCGNLAASDISVYTVQVNTGADPTSQMLKDCATDPSQTFLLTTADAIVTAFASIGTSLSQLRISE